MPCLAQKNDHHQFSNGSTKSLHALSCSGVSVSVNGVWSKNNDDVGHNQLQKFWSELSPQARKDLLRIDKQTFFEQARKNMYCSRCNGLLLEGFLQIVMYGRSFQQEGAIGDLPCGSLRASKHQHDGDMCVTSGCEDDVQEPSVYPWGGLTTTRDGVVTILDCYLHSKSLKGLQNVFDSARARERERELLYPDACGGGGRGWMSQGMGTYGRGYGTRETCALHTARLSVDTLVDFWSALGEETRQSLLRMKEEDFIERLMYRFDSKRFCRDCRRNVIRELKELKELKRMRREPRCTNWFCVADTDFEYEVSHDTIQADWHETFAGTSGTYHHFEWAVGTGEGKSDILDFEDVGLSGRVYVSDLDLGGLNACYITLRAWKKDGRCCELYAKAHALKGQQCVHCRLVVGDGYVTIKKGESIKRFFEHAEETEEEEDDDSMDKDGNEMDGECSRPQKHAKSPELAREFLLDAATVIFKEQVEKAFREGTARQNAHSIFVCLSLKLLEECLHVAFKEIITLEKQMKLLEEEEKEKREEEERKERKRTKEREKKLRRKERLREKERETRSDPDPDPDPNPNPNFVVPDGSKEESTGNVDDNELDFIEPKDSMVETVENGQDHSDREGAYVEDRNGFPTEHSKSSNQKPKYQNDSQLNQTLKRFDRNGPVYDSDRSVNGSKQLWSRNRGPKYVEKFQSCGCNQQNDYRAKVEPESILDMSKPYYRGNKYNQMEYGHRNCGRPKIKTMSNRNQSGRDFAHVKKVWEPRSNSDSDLMNSTSNLLESSAATCDEKATANSIVPTQSAKKSVDDDEVESCNTTTTASVNGAKDPSLSGNSSSDNCSSCVSDDASQHSEGLENSPENLKNGFSQPQEVEIERLKQAPETAKTEPLRIEPTKTAQDQDNGKKVNVNLGSQPQGALHQGIQFPLFQPPAMGYYHHSPVSWPTAPANGLFPFPHPNPYLFASPYGYGVNGNTHFFNYGVPEHHVLPVLGPTHLPLFQQFAQTNKLDAKDRARNHEGGLQKEVETRTCLKESPPKAGAKQGNCSSTGFSLFHFGGPVAALQSGDESNTAAEEEIVGDDVSSNHVKKDAIEEYNLFSASNGLKFSFF